MNNFKFYVQELRKAFSTYNDYSIDMILSSDNDLSHHDYLIPEKVSDVKERRARANTKLSSNDLYLRRYKQRKIRLV